MPPIKLPHDHSHETLEVLKLLPDTQEFIQAADTFRQLADGTRLKILWILCHCEECVSNIAAAVEMTDPAVSHHLRILKQSGLIDSRREGKEVYYKITGTENAKLVHKMIDDYFQLNCPSSSL